MKWLFLFLMVWSGTSYAGDADSCVRLTKTYGENCGNSNSIQIKVRNSCSTPVTHKVCIYNSNEKLECFQGTLDGSDEQDYGYYVCDKGRGGVVYVGCFASSYKDGSCKLPKKEDM
jgi:hypothetical protein